MKKFKSRCLQAVLMTLSLFAVCNSANAADNLVEVADKAGTFKTLLTAAKAVGLAHTLQEEGPFTVFAPTDDAFAKLPKHTLDGLLKPENKEKLATILKYHVLAGKVTAKNAVQVESAKTRSGDSVTISIRDGRLAVNDATVILNDVEASNGIIHVIDSVLMPPESTATSSKEEKSNSHEAPKNDYSLPPSKVNHGQIVGNTLLVINCPRLKELPPKAVSRLGPDWSGKSSDGFRLVAGAVNSTTVGESLWEPDGSRREGQQIFVGNGINTTWTFNAQDGNSNLPDGAVINAIYATWNTRGKSGAIYSYSEGPHQSQTTRVDHTSKPHSDLEIRWTDAEHTVMTAKFQKIFKGPIAIVGNDGFTLSAQKIPGRNCHQTDAIILDVTMKHPSGPHLPQVSSDQRLHPTIDTASGSKMAIPSQNIVETAVAAGNFKTLITAAKAAGLADTLQGEGPFTVLAPSDEAFAKLPHGTIESLLKPENKHELQAILNYHLIPGRISQTRILSLRDAGKSLGYRTLANSFVSISIQNNRLVVNDANVLVNDVEASNGIIHVIDSVLLPPKPKN